MRERESIINKRGSFLKEERLNKNKYIDFKDGQEMSKTNKKKNKYKKKGRRTTRRKGEED